MSVMSLRGILLTVVLMILSLTDLHGWIIPDRLQIAGCVIFLATALFLPDPIQRIFGGLFLGLILGGGCFSYLWSLINSQGRKALAGAISNCFL